MRLLLAVVVMVLAGCAQNRDQNTDQKRNLRRETTEVRQVVVDSKVVQLTTKTLTIERETSAEQQSERIEIEQPKVLTDLADGAKALLKAGAAATMGPAGPAAVDWIWQTVAGVGAMGAAGGAGVVMRERTKRRQMIKAQSDYASDLEDAETDDDVKEVKKKHAERQKALGIHDQLTQERHGV